MPKVAKELSAIEVKRIIQQGFYAVGGVAGLMLQVASGRSRSWILRARIGEKRRDIGLGGYPEVSLAKARELALEKKDKISRGIDPVEEKKANKARLIASQRNTITFDNAADKVHAIKCKKFTNEKYKSQWISAIRMYASPLIGKMPIAEIDLASIKQVFDPIWDDKTDTASKMRGNIEQILAWATVNGYRKGENPARWQGYLDQIYNSPNSGERAHQPALPFKELPQFISEINKKNGLAARMLEFAILTGGRSNEVMGAKWDEFNLEEKVWTVPKSRMGKTKREHRVALSNNAIELIKSLPRISDDYVFPTPRNNNKPMSNNAMNKVVMDMHEAEMAIGRKGWIDPKEGNRRIVPHGFRSTFRDWASERTNHSHEVKEMALAHTVGSKVEAAYRRGDLFQKRIELMQDWADFINTVSKTAVVIR